MALRSNYKVYRIWHNSVITFTSKIKTKIQTTQFSKSYKYTRGPAREIAQDLPPPHSSDRLFGCDSVRVLQPQAFYNIGFDSIFTFYIYLIVK